MSRPDRPYRSTHVLQERTIHYDYATKEERARSGSSEISLGYHFTTVTSRKPLKPGTPVCWVNVYPEGTGPSPAVHSTKEFADRGADKTRRLHCIPVYLPGEGQPGNVVLLKKLAERDAEVRQLRAEVEQKHDTITAVVAQRDQAYAEVERLTKELAAAQAQAMPAGKVVYGASRKFGINRVFQTIEFADKRLRDTYRKADGWTWFTRVEES